MAVMVVGRAFILLIALLMVWSGGFIFWQQINQPSNNGCYYFPAGTMSVAFFLQPYQASCGFGALPNYFASDIALTLLVSGFLISIITVQTGTKGTSVQLG